MTTDISRCIRGDSAPCSCVCPFYLDTRGLCDKLRRGSYDAAFNIFRNAVAFPDIVSRLCPQPCRNRCVLHGNAVELRALEASALQYARNKDPLPFNIPAKEKSIAVIGGGPSGLACALRVASKGYKVVIYEKAAQWGGSLKDLLPEEIYLADICRQFKYTKNYELVTGRAVTALDELAFDAAYIATGTGGNDFGLGVDVDPVTCETVRPGVFLGGGMTGLDAVSAIAAGLRAARYLERWLMTGQMLRTSGENNVEPDGTTRLTESLFTSDDTPPVSPAGEPYSRDESKQEAGRCLRCDCEQCSSRCDFLSYYRVSPTVLKQRVEGEFVSDGKITEGNSRRLIAACNACGACGDHCPESIDIGEFLLESRRRLHREEKLPSAWHDFWLRDMAFACEDEAAVYRPAPNGEKNRYMYFPGCQLGASDPRYVTESYRWLLAHEPDTALLLACCGAPAEWAGQETEHAERIAAIRTRWEELGQPTAVFACPSCQKMLQKYLPEMDSVSVYELMAPWGAPPGADAGRAAVFDACSSRQEPEMQRGVRSLLKSAGMTPEELPNAGSEALCCGWGGNVSISNPGYYHKVVKNRVGESDLPYVCYCTNCRDSFAGAGKEAYHVFDMLFGLNAGNRKPPDVSRRRENRRELKGMLLRGFWNENWKEKDAVELIIEPELAERLDKELILADDIRTVIETCEETGRKLKDTVSGSFIGHTVIGPVTYWVEYVPENSSWRVLNAYSHRLAIQEKE